MQFSYFCSLHGNSSVTVDAFEEFPFEELNSHDGKDEPEEETNEEDVEDGRDGVHQSIHDHLHSLPPRNGSERT
jgi:hypothetical protein